MLIFASDLMRGHQKPSTDFFHNLYIVFPHLLPQQVGFFVLSIVPTGLG